MELGVEDGREHRLAHLNVGKAASWLLTRPLQMPKVSGNTDCVTDSVNAALAYNFILLR
jgi:hypothetical protein